MNYEDDLLPYLRERSQLGLPLDKDFRNKLETDLKETAYFKRNFHNMADPAEMSDLNLAGWLISALRIDNREKQVKIEKRFEMEKYLVMSDYWKDHEIFVPPHQMSDEFLEFYINKAKEYSKCSCLHSWKEWPIAILLASGLLLGLWGIIFGFYWLVGR